MNKTLFIVTFFVISALIISGCSSSKTQVKQEPTMPTAANPTTITPTTPSSTDSVTIKDFKFTPNQVNVKAGAKITWTNQDGANHIVAFDDNSFMSDELANGDTVTFTFDKKGTYTYHCGIHPSMKGTVVVE